MKTLVLFLASSLSCFAQAVLDNAADLGYTATGGTSKTYVATGTNLVAYMHVWADTCAPTTPVITGGSWNQIAGSPFTNTQQFGGKWYVYVAVGFSAGSLTVGYGGACQTIGLMVDFSNAKQTGQPEAIGSFTNASSTLNGSPPPIGLAPAAVTTSSVNAVVVGFFGSGTNMNSAQSPTSTATITAAYNSTNNDSIWISSPVASPGSFTLNGGIATALQSYNGLAISVASFASASVTANPSVSVIAVGSPR